MEVTPEGKLFIARQDGILPVWQNGAELAADFFATAPLLTDPSGERGLLGVALDPNFAFNRYLYVYYTISGGDHRNRVSRFTADATGTQALVGSEVVIWEGDAHPALNHNGGAIHFGSDGKLYIATGDNANGSDSQSLTSQHGKILRINADGTIPVDNPFFDGTGPNRDAIWSLGLRNPFTFAFQPGTGRMFVNDVGEYTWEEINDGGAASSGRGLNFGWPETEGNFDAETFPDYVEPLFSYSHSGATTPFGTVITGGAFYNPATNIFGAAYEGDYFFSDLGGGWISRIDPATREVTLFASNVSALDLKATADGSLYYLSYYPHKVFRVERSPASAPVFTIQPQGQTVEPGTVVTFRVDAVGAPAIQWQRSSNNGSTWTNIKGARTKSLVITATLTDNNVLFRAVATNAKGAATSNAVRLFVVANEPPNPPQITITGGLTNAKFIAGQSISFTASATDPEDGELGDGAFYWIIYSLKDIDDGDKDKDGLPGVSQISTTVDNRSGNFVPSTGGRNTDPDIAYAFTVRVTDSKGVISTQRYVVYPNTVTLTLAAEPGGLQLVRDGSTVKTPHTFVSVVGFFRSIGAIRAQAQGATSFVFDSWSDGGAETHSIQTPAVATTFTAKFATSLLPLEWSNQDIGSVKVAGSVRYTPVPLDLNRFDVNGSGVLKAKADSFHFVYMPVEGDCSITARVGSLPFQKRGKEARGGVMIRADLTPGSPHAFVGPRAKGSAQFVSRDRPNQTCEILDASSVGVAIWVRITREGGIVSAFTSYEGRTWTKIRSLNTIQLPSNAYIGLVVCSGGAAWQPGQFDSVTVSP